VKPVINDFSIHVATVNGSGSQTANTVLLRAIFQMGIPVSGKNLFPSNIAGLPTWFTIRASGKGYLARGERNDVLVVMNPETAAEDVASVEPGCVVVLNDQIKIPALPEDRIVYSVPMKSLIEPITTDVKLRRLVVNMIYVGVLAELIGIDEKEIERALDAQLGHKKKALELNHKAVRAGWEWAKASLEKRDPYKLERMSATQGKILIDGNAAGALGAMFGGVTVATWYPITPSSSLVESLIGYLERFRRDPQTGKANFAVVQAEDEIAAVGMVLGAGWAGAARDDVHVRSRHLADGGVHRLRLLRGDPCGDLGHPARRSEHGLAHPHRAGGHRVRAFALARRHPPRRPAAIVGARLLRLRDGGLRSGRAAPDAGVRTQRSRPRHEQLDERSLPLSREALGSEARC
jgi:Pyruvate/2-oxoacid:ferredoxin oxidoreductase gamma subunit